MNLIPTISRDGQLPEKFRPHGYEKSPTHEVYSQKILKVVRVREVKSSNLSTPTDKVQVDSQPEGVCFLFTYPNFNSNLDFDST